MFRGMHPRRRITVNLAYRKSSLFDRMNKRKNGRKKEKRSFTSASINDKCTLSA